MKKKHHILFLGLCMTFVLQAYGSSELIQDLPGLGATLVCPFTVTNGPASIGDVEVVFFGDTSCGVGSLLGNYAWGGRGGAPTLTNGRHTLSNDAMATVGLTALTTTSSLQVTVHNPAHTTYASVCMQATISSGIVACGAGPYTLDLNGL